MDGEDSVVCVPDNNPLRPLHRSPAQILYEDSD